VVRVGSFEASFVPSIKDFSRLDDRFRLPTDIWEKLPGYRSWGFAVFKLKSGAAKIHPMAFSFPRRDLKFLFFPTVHIHDGQVHPKAGFDHELYCQPRDDEGLKLDHWLESFRNSDDFMNVTKTKGIVQADQHCYRRVLRGLLPNRDTFVSIAA
jgi:hypothetical protein